MEYRVTRIKNAKGTVYLYEDMAYRDKERGYSTHKRKCIGKIGADGKPEYNEYYLTREKMRGMEQKISEIELVSTTTLVG